MARLRHFMRVDPETREWLFGFQFRPGEDIVGWWTVEQITEAADAAVRIVGAREFAELIRTAWPEHEFNTEDTGP